MRKLATACALIIVAFLTSMEETQAQLRNCDFEQLQAESFFTPPINTPVPCPLPYAGPPSLPCSIIDLIPMPFPFPGTLVDPANKPSQLQLLKMNEKSSLKINA